MKFVVALILLCHLPAAADGEKDNDPRNVRQVPRAGIEVPAARADAMRRELDRLATQIAAVRQSGDAWRISLLPDVEIFHRAVRCALDYDEFFARADLDRADELLRIARHRSEALSAGRAPWLTAPGPVVLGYRSKIDQTVQPYGLVIPDDYGPAGRERHRLDIWFHGRGETLSEVKFAHERHHTIGPYAPDGAFVLDPYGRYSNAFKFAGEIDVLEALADAQRRFRIDEDRISVRGFSMGGAACWQFAVHYADRWFAANPGAGFSETPEFLKFFQKETLHPTWYEKRLWQWYDCPGYAANLVHCPTVAYSGELDIQKQAADIMEPALAAEGVRLVHIIGPGTKHAIHADSKAEIERRMASLAEVGRDRFPNPLRFTTYTLRYNRMHWLEVTELQEHWQPARVRAGWDGNTLRIAVENVEGMSVSFPPGDSPFAPGVVRVVVNDTLVGERPPLSDRSFECAVYRAGNTWHFGTRPDAGLRKRHELQGPIDDAFMDSFVFVTPTGKSSSPAFRKWRENEQARAIREWRRHFRGDAVVRTDAEVSDADIADSNLILWGDPQSNSVLRRIVSQLPIRWDDGGIQTGTQQFSSQKHALLLVYPNPLNPKRYVVLNSGFTYREYAYLNNARQVPMLPDWAVVDLETPPGTQFPGKVVQAGFFDEHWQLKPRP